MRSDHSLHTHRQDSVQSREDPRLELPLRIPASARQRKGGTQRAPWPPYGTRWYSHTQSAQARHLWCTTEGRCCTPHVRGCPKALSVRGDTLATAGSTAQGRCCRNALLDRETVLGTVRGRRAPGGAEETTAQGRGTGTGRSERPHAAFVHRILRWTIWPRCCAEERKPSIDQSQTGLWLRAIAMRAHSADSLMSQSHSDLSHLQPSPS